MGHEKTRYLVTTNYDFQFSRVTRKITDNFPDAMNFLNEIIDPLCVKWYSIYRVDCLNHYTKVYSVRK